MVSLSAFIGDLPFLEGFVFGLSGIIKSELKCLKWLKCAKANGRFGHLETY
jgi:hypothetical protein